MLQKLAESLLKNNKFLKIEVRLTAFSFIFMFPLIMRLFSHQPRYDITWYLLDMISFLVLYLILYFILDLVLPFSSLVKAIIFAVIAIYVGITTCKYGDWNYWVRYFVFPGLLIFFTLYKTQVVEYLNRLSNNSEET